MVPPYRPSFAQREGLEAVPPQLQPGTLSKQARASLWHVIYQSMEASIRSGTMSSYFIEPWSTILRDWLVDTQHGMSNDFESGSHEHEQRLKALFTKGRYHEVLGFVEYVLHHSDCPGKVKQGVASSLINTRTAYTIVDGDTICPISGDVEAAVLARAFEDLAQTPFEGAKSHLKAAAGFLTVGKFADSVRESVHSVEATARLLAPTATSGLGPALTELEKMHAIHGAMKAGFGSLYGYASNEKGIRHPLLEEGSATVDQYDALFMMGSCASFVSYLIGKGRSVGLLK